MRYFLPILSILLFYVPLAKGQNFHAGLLPEASVSYKWSEKLQQTVKIESAHEMYHSETALFEYTYDQTDIQLFLEGKLNPFIKIAGGYQYRVEGKGENPHRFIQQAAVLQRMTGFRIGHRFRTDQTIYTSEAVKYRLRYRLSAEFPLEGQSLDAGELYLLMSGEPIHSLQDAKSDMEVRLATSFGYFINNKTKLEMGLDYRLENILVDPVRQKLWLKLGWFFVI